MTIINLKFSPDMEEAIMEGRKCCTTRDKRKGEIGDLFVIKDRVYRLTDIQEVDSLDIQYCHRNDGFENVTNYMEKLHNLYPDKFKDLMGEPIPVLYVHYFAYVKPNKNYSENSSCQK